jgi:hypothetical protein
LENPRQPFVAIASGLAGSRGVVEQLVTVRCAWIDMELGLHTGLLQSTGIVEPSARIWDLMARHAKVYVSP